MRKIQGSKGGKFITARFLMCFSIAFILLLLSRYDTLEVKAEADDGIQSENIQGNLMEAAVDTVGREQQSMNAASVMELPAGTHILVVGEETDGWYEIYSQGKTAYVPSKDLISPTILDAAQLEQEMKKIEEEDKAFIESLEMQRKAVARSKVWRTVIIILIAGVFVTGVISALRKPKNEEKPVSGKKNTGKIR